MKAKTQFICQQCGATFSKWQGQCSSCQAWNSLVEELLPQPSLQKKASAKLDATLLQQKILSFSQVTAQKGSKKRFSTTIEELDRVLGGGLVPGAIVLIGGEPGIGKSTLLTQMVLKLGEQIVAPLVVTKKTLSKENDPKKAKGDLVAKNMPLQKIFYVCGEESPNQIALRINRFLSNEQENFPKKEPAAKPKNMDKKVFLQNLQFITTMNVDEISALINQEKPDLVIIDSIQTLFTQDLVGTSGSVGQIKECTDRLINVAKPLDIPLFLVGHVTKEGVISGPKVLEHMVDAVLQLEGERTGNLRVLRALKNRFGATDEVGLFRVVSFGMEEVTNPGEFFLEDHNQAACGSAIVGVLEGTRPLIIEVQALVVPSQLAMPRRVGRGIDLARIQILSAVLQKHGSLPLGECDVFLSAAGGFKIKEPAVDLGLAIAIASSLKNKSLPAKTVFIGEVGLLGEIRNVPYLDQRIKEAKRLGFTKVISRKTHQHVRQVLKEFI